MQPKTPESARPVSVDIEVESIAVTKAAMARKPVFIVMSLVRTLGKLARIERQTVCNLREGWNR